MATNPQYPVKPVDRTVNPRKPGIPVPTDRNVQDTKQLRNLLQNIIENLRSIDTESATTSKIVEVLTGGSGLTGSIPAIPDVNVYIQDADPGTKTFPYFWIRPGATPPDTTSLLMYIP